MPWYVFRLRWFGVLPGESHLTNDTGNVLNGTNV